MQAFLTFMSISGFPAFVEDMMVFVRERLNGYYQVRAWVFTAPGPSMLWSSHALMDYKTHKHMREPKYFCAHARFFYMHAHTAHVI
jgi:hypothetical protein